MGFLSSLFSGSNKKNRRERRSSYRHKIDASALLYKYDGDDASRPKISRVVNMGNDGACISTKYPLPEGEHFMLEILLDDDDPLMVPCRVVRSQAQEPGYTLTGVCFDEASDAELDAVHEFLLRLQNEERKEQLRDEFY